jgi:2-iminobutanoate/2-iminopropanoate deaminase
MKSPRKEVIIPDGGAPPLAPYSPGIRFGNLVFTSGQIGLDPHTGKLVSTSLEDETRQALVNLNKILEAAGSSLTQALKITVYIKDIADYPVVNKIYGEFFLKDPPARAVIQGMLPAGAAIEFDAIAALKERAPVS